MSDSTKRPLTFPNWHIPYLEKHRILELFHEVARELVIQKPEDHVLFMKQILQNAAAGRDVSRVILISSGKVNRINLAEEIAKYTRQMVITSSDILNIFRNKMKNVSGDYVGKALVYLVRSQAVMSSGWIIADCVNTEEEAKSLLTYGVLPTHVLHIVPQFQPKLDDLLYCNVSEHWPEVRRNLFGLKQLFHKSLHEIIAGNKDLPSLAKDCADVIKIHKHVKRVMPRVVILGPRGSGRKTQAKLLTELLGLVHVDFPYILCQAWISENELGAKLRQCKKKVCLHSELLCQIVNKRVLEEDCLQRGWVLTGYPYTDIDFMFLDSIDTPPNRVVILDCDLNVCKERICHRKRNVFTGSVTNLKPSGEPNAEVINKKKSLRTHPKDAIDIIEAEHQFYCQRHGSIKKYCGDTAKVINADQNERWIHETIVAYILGANPTGIPRKGFQKDIPEVCGCDCVKIPPSLAKTYLVSV
ncbi:hypothetical protein GWI33_014888 [Rhynchophorus ferrugineus]|uniref:Adenylate kinase 8 n=1 Tax=Rhynchophorus ferrugineus TaxID=354439 RepID=A0A834MBY4_RHYFE|nr:hypothetical protein GWI33_014888 [Rhynchophorus ferrugineus]